MIYIDVILSLIGLCSCKTKYLGVQKDSTIEQSKHKEFEHITHHLFCTVCNKKHDIKYAKTKAEYDGPENYHKWL